MPYTELPDDFREKHPSVWVDELEYAASCGYDAICVNEHHSSDYGFSPSPNLIASSPAAAPSPAGPPALGQVRHVGRHDLAAAQRTSEAGRTSMVPGRGYRQVRAGRPAEPAAVPRVCDPGTPRHGMADAACRGQAIGRRTAT
jgi:hypothetical protein